MRKRKRRSIKKEKVKENMKLEIESQKKSSGLKKTNRSC